MRPKRQLCFGAAGVALIAFGCSGRSTSVAGDDDAVGAAGQHVGGLGAAGGKSGVGGRGVGGKAGTGGTGDVPFEDPGCPDIEPPAGVLECGVFDAPCGDGLACKPQLEHPYGSGCDQQVLNLRCVLPGLGQQGDSCDDGAAECGAGFICVVGASHGARCLRMCPLDGSIRCPSGYVCGPTDADGIGVCA